MIVKILRFLLFPFSILYGFIMEIRNWFFDIGILKSMKFSVPIISVGNITAGGTGKTPFTIYLAYLLKKHFSTIAIVSRGYGRKSRGMQLVSDGQQILLDPSHAGDEPYLIASQLPECLVAVSEERNVAINYLIENYKPDLIILDDAFQHRQVKRDMDIVLINTNEKSTSKFILPTGNLREYKHNLKRADVLIFTNSERVDKKIFNRYSKYTENIYSTKSKLGQLVNIDLNIADSLNGLKNRPVFALAGIANPINFKNTLIGNEIDVIAFESYPDHYPFNSSDLVEIIDYCKEKGCQNILCTEKDLVKISRLEGIKEKLNEAGIQLFGVQLKLELLEYDQLLKNIKTMLDNTA